MSSPTLIFQFSSLQDPRMQQQQRVLADGWGHQTTGSVFCADSSLRFIYESNSTSRQAQEHPQPAQIQRSPFHPDKNIQRTFGGKRTRDYLTTTHVRDNQGVDIFEAEIARACSAIRKQAVGLPPSFRECSVCLSSNAWAQISACGHTFHPHCFLRWFRLNRSCPICRGPVDKVQLAPSMAVPCELEAIMAEIDHEPLQLMDERRSANGNLAPLEDDSLLATSDPLMSFFAADFDTDMELMALDEFSNEGVTSEALELDFKRESNENMDMDMMEELVDTGHNDENMERDAQLTSVTPQFPPASAMPNYWNVLNQGMIPSIVPPAPAVPPQRMVHIAPKPETTNTPVWTTEQTFQVPVPQVPQQIQNHHHHDYAVRASTPATPRVVSCRCTGGCRNGRCACVKEGGMCGASCRCTSCKNPFLMVKAAGADVDALLKDDCFMHNVSKTRDMVQRLQESVAVPCCEGTIKVIDCVQGYTCEPCKRRYDFSWCMNKLLLSDRTPRNHCAICKRCCDHRDVHCHNCGRCYFSGVAASLPCPCKEASSHKKRREAAARDKVDEADEEAEGECCIM